jgi:cyclopropane fatty-acyl-phospholipid synthase-like methyltransferase
MNFTKKDINDVIDRYTKRYKEYGYVPKTLGWDKGNQEIRFDILTSQYNFNNKHILDIGCGFGDLNKTLIKKSSNYRYSGIDLVEVLLDEAKRQYPGVNISFEKANILDFKPGITFDYAISSGIFNHKLTNSNSYEFIEAVIEKALSLSEEGLAFDFLSDKVDYKLEHTFHSSPEKILSIAYKFSRNVILRNDYMPFEFSVFIFKDQTFNKDKTVFKRYLTPH